MEAEILVADVRSFETREETPATSSQRLGGRRVHDLPGGDRRGARFGAKGARARILTTNSSAASTRTSTSIKIEPLEGDAGPSDDTDPEEAGWRTAVDAAPWLVGNAEPTDEVPPDELFEKLKPFKDRVAEDIREEDAPASE